MKKSFFLILLLLCLYSSTKAQYSTLNVHSHNDYQQKNPFYEAYSHHFGSIEADIWEVNGVLLVAHEKDQINPKKTLDAMYIQPIVRLFHQNRGKVWNDYSGSFQLLIELKSDAAKTLKLVIDLLQKYPEVFDRSINQNAVMVTITGNCPSPDLFATYPGFIHFDGKLNLKYDEPQRSRIALFSDDLEQFTSWKGIGDIPVNEQKKLQHVIDSVHALNHKIRFWNAPDNPNAWQTLMNLNVDYINTDHIQQMDDFLHHK